MDKEFVPYELAVKLKALGFDEPCLAQWIEKDSREGGGIKLEIWNDEDTIFEVKSWTKAPLYQQAFRWFREKHDLFCWIEKFHVDETYIFQIPPANFTKVQGHYITYEEAELACLEKLIEIVETRTK